MAFDRHTVGKADAGTHEQAMRRRGFELVDRAELSPDTWIHRWKQSTDLKLPSKGVELKQSAPTANKRSKTGGTRGSQGATKKRPPRKNPAASRQRKAATPQRLPATEATASTHAADAKVLTDELIAAYQRTLREANGAVPTDQIPVVARTIAVSSQQASRDMRLRMSEADADRLAKFHDDLPDYLGTVLGWVGDKSTDFGKKQAIGVATGTTTLAAIHAKIVAAAVLAGGVATAIAAGIWSLGAQASQSSGFMYHALPVALFGGGVGKWAKNREAEIREAWNGPQAALYYLDRTLTPVESKVFARLGTSPPRRVVLKASGAVEAAVLAICAAVVAVVCGIFVIAAIVTWFHSFSPSGTGPG